jgi:hypothetical protein
MADRDSTPAFHLLRRGLLNSPGRGFSRRASPLPQSGHSIRTRNSIDRTVGDGRWERLSITLAECRLATMQSSGQNDWSQARMAQKASASAIQVGPLLQQKQPWPGWRGQFSLRPPL